MRWPNGSATAERGTGLSPCAQGWVDTYIAQVLQLVDMGAEAFYFDEYPQRAETGTWSARSSLRPSMVFPCQQLWVHRCRALEDLQWRSTGVFSSS